MALYIQDSWTIADRFIFDIATARNYDRTRTYYGLSVTEDQVLSRNWNLTDPGIGYVADSAYGKEIDFYPPISVRFGVKFIF
ncbi:MAG: hypothetical protein OEY18_10720 [Candidatus Aminicenantes bacterium]|nr:hypothetical protein [Candidatus Aminicenantes bacterium]MDH5385169.1 hypothetical protein [Candidatus Aminicenantes bacterium]MDH5742028.1 hypothetical protein [Candidatus Aminicenantes bacterium]